MFENVLVCHLRYCEVFISSGEAMIDFFLDIKFFRLLLGTVPGVIYSIGEDKSSLCLSGSTSDVLNI